MDRSSDKNYKRDGNDGHKRKHTDVESFHKRRRMVDGDSSNVVARHYNQLPESGLRQRKQSKIYFMRNFNNWVKSVLMKTFQIRLETEGQRSGIVALDVGCGKGGDLLKWAKGNVNKVICTDLAATSIEQCKDRYGSNKQKARGRIFDAEFIVADSSREKLSDLFDDPGQMFDLVSIQFVVHYSFESESQANRMIQNCCERLRKGGYFIGTTVNSKELRRRLDESENNSFGNSVYSVSFSSKDKFNDFGHTYNFHLDGVVDCPEYVASRENLENIAKKFGMRLVLWKTFSDFFAMNARDREFKDLLKRIKALEYFPSRSPNSNKPGDYDHAKAVCDDIMEKYPESNPRVGTLSSTEWEAASLYVAFAFKKIDENDDETFDVPASDINDIPLLVLSR
uniref:mRNA cap guanine-N7 methyltransferase-like n=1 Tax=Styela clava TaxID=7725 RepID=UPI00193A2BDA|nr:mRNA cap guanine-N7 methyltransferase-like [Styela clava]